MPGRRYRPEPMRKGPATVSDLYRHGIARSEQVYTSRRLEGGFSGTISTGNRNPIKMNFGTSKKRELLSEGMASSPNQESTQGLKTSDFKPQGKKRPASESHSRVETDSKNGKVINRRKSTDEEESDDETLESMCLPLTKAADIEQGGKERARKASNPIKSLKTSASDEPTMKEPRSLTSIFGGSTDVYPKPTTSSPPTLTPATVKHNVAEDTQGCLTTKSLPNPKTTGTKRKAETITDVNNPESKPPPRPIKKPKPHSKINTTIPKSQVYILRIFKHTEWEDSTSDSSSPRVSSPPMREYIKVPFGREIYQNLSDANQAAKVCQLKLQFKVGDKTAETLEQKRKVGARIERASEAGERWRSELTARNGDVYEVAVEQVGVF
ncbi:hypothetical protein EJ04DRAFT_523336 [Polyplosphaeria fusca]|uniref:Uncharacterized protein n=1 Tax=Polyplosphaeria fusca TaxID=682080 RepID=A0A9P4V331_9PLEO|nr:hypothetical protein EJ04DRAFT_523336 [Polyplosphaeria fusca]